MQFTALLMTLIMDLGMYNIVAELPPTEDILANTRKIAEELSKATVTNNKQKLKELAETMDMNHDRAVDHEELTRWLLKSFRVLSKEESEERFEEADTNHDQVVTWDEYLIDMYGENSQMDGDQDMIREDKEIFVASDTNHDGKLDKTEYLSFTHPEEHLHTMDILYRRTMNEKDLNKDGYLDFQEFIASEGKDRDEEWRVAEKDRFDNDFDLDHDGKMGKDEILHWLSPNNKVSAMEEADHLIQTADDNGDKILSIAEIIKHHDAFTGSEITDFGHHLENVHKFIKDEL